MSTWKELAWVFWYHTDEFRASMTYKVLHEPVNDIEMNKDAFLQRPTMKRCWEFLDLTSRSFAAVIKELQGELTRAVCIFYIVLRALDTVEDDMTIDIDTKVNLLKTFHEKLDQEGWTFQGSQEKDKVVLEEFDKVIAEYQLLDVKYQVPIKDVCRKMGAGMAHYARLGADKKNALFSLETKGDLDLYCHYVAGLVGEGVSSIFSASDLESPTVGRSLTLANSMGLFLQKTNIMRDFREDVLAGRLFWPREIWSQGGQITDPNQLLNLEANAQTARNALSEMIFDTLLHIPDVLEYLTLLKNQSVFNFCAIPQAMAVATLDECFGNLDVFRKNVKIRRTKAAQIMFRATNPRDTALLFRDCLRSIHSKARPSDPLFLQICILAGNVEQWLEGRYPTWLTDVKKIPANRETALTLPTADARVLTLPSRKEQSEEEKAQIQRQKSQSGIDMRETLLLIGGIMAFFVVILGIPCVIALWYFGAFENAFQAFTEWRAKGGKFEL